MPHIELKLLSPEAIRAILEGPAVFTAVFGVPTADGIRELYTSGEITEAYMATLLAPNPADPYLHGFAIVHPEAACVIGTAGFKGGPDADGVVEMGYGLAPAFQGKGLATAAARQLVEYAFADPRVRTVMAHTLPVNGASQRILTKCGFTHVGEEVDPDDGLVWRWELPRP